MRVFVYYNLHKRVWSVKALEGPNRGRVIAHSRCVSLSDVECRVSEAGRQRVLRDKRKNVHAGLVGTLQLAECAIVEVAPGYAVADITYNPYIGPTFFRKDNGAPVRRARHAVMLAGEKVRVSAVLERDAAQEAA